MSKIKTVLFDVGGTLIHPYPSVGQLYAEGAAQFGIELTAEESKQRFFNGWIQAKSHWTKDIKYGRTEEEAKEFWFEVVKNSFDNLLPLEKIKELFDYLYYLFADDKIWRCYPEVMDTLNKLRGDGYSLAILSNWDTRLAPVLKGLGISALMDHIFISCEMGYEKPHHNAFNIALNEMNCQHDEVIYIGNDYDEDYIPAKQLGIETLLIKRGDHIEPREEVPYIKLISDVYSYL